MKKIIISLTLLTVMMFTSSQAGNIRLGIGIPLEHERDITLSNYGSSIVLHKFTIPIVFYSTIRIIPEFGYWKVTHKYDSEKVKYSVFHYGFGLYYVKSFGNNRMYFGPRLVAEQLNRPKDYPNPDIISSKTDHIYGLTLGAEHLFVEHFSIGFEVQYNYYEINPLERSGYYGTRLRRVLESVFIVAFYF